MSRIVVVGRTGQVASELQRQALPPSWSVIALGRDRIDLASGKDVTQSIADARPNILINAAAYTAVDRAEAEEDLAMQVNGHAPGHLARIAAGLGIPFLHLSTDYVFDGREGRAWREDDEPNPLNAYGRSKLAGERGVLEADVRSIILRTSWVFSPFGSNFVKTMLRLGAERDELSVVADQYGGPTAASDIAAALFRLAILLVADPKPSQSGIYHYCGAPVASWAELAEAVFERADWLPTKPQIVRIASADYPLAARRPQNSALDCTRIRQDFGIGQPSWRSSLAVTLDKLRPMP